MPLKTSLSFIFIFVVVYITTYWIAENSDGQKKKPLRIAIVRPFSLIQAENLVSSFDTWENHLPCRIENEKKENPTYEADLFLSFSQSYSQSPDVRKETNQVNQIFHSNKWGNQGCFQNLKTIEANIPLEEDMYEPSLSQIDSMWVNGPNRQFESAFHTLQSMTSASSESGYDVMFLMEADSKPVKSYWLDSLVEEITQQSPFGILGSKYDGDSWDQFKDKLPLALVNHINGNAVYNLTHPFIGRIVNQMKSEAQTPFNSVPYDYRISQIAYEGSHGIVPDLNIGLLRNHKDDFGSFDDSENDVIMSSSVLANNTKKFNRWWTLYDGNTSMKESKIISNFAATNVLERHLSDASIIHGANMFSPWDPSEHDITLVVSEWYSRLSSHLLSEIDSSKHPFSNIVLMLPSDLPEDDIPDASTTKSVIVENQYRKSSDFMDICEAEISTEWFMMTNAYHTVAKYVDLLFTSTDKEKGEGRRRPVISYVPADTQHCFQFDGCGKIYDLALMIEPNLKVVFRDSDILYKTSLRDEFCKYWKGEFGMKGEKLKGVIDNRSARGPSGTSYMAYLMSLGIEKDVYSFSASTQYGVRDNFEKVFTVEEANEGHSLAMNLERRMSDGFTSNSEEENSISFRSAPTGPTNNKNKGGNSPPVSSPSSIISEIVFDEPNSLRCEKFCYSLDVPWTLKDRKKKKPQKCDWKFSCLGCPECMV